MKFYNKINNISRGELSWECCDFRVLGRLRPNPPIAYRSFCLGLSPNLTTIPSFFGIIYYKRNDPNRERFLSPNRNLLDLENINGNFTVSTQYVCSACVSTHPSDDEHQSCTSRKVNGWSPVYSQRTLDSFQLIWCVLLEIPWFNGIWVRDSAWIDNKLWEWIIWH